MITGIQQTGIKISSAANSNVLNSSRQNEFFKYESTAYM